METPIQFLLKLVGLKSLKDVKLFNPDLLVNQDFFFSDFCQKLDKFQLLSFT